MSDEMTDKLQSILSNPEMMELISGFVSKGDKKISDSESSADITSSLKSVMDRINGDSDKRINLLYALKPYMSSSRASGIDKAVRMLKLTQLTSIMKDL